MPTGTSKIYLGTNTTVEDILNRTAAEGVVISMATYEVLGRDPCGGQPLLYSL
jgi:hypothetical protein